MNRFVKLLPQRWQYFAYEWGVLIIAGVIFLGASAAYLILRTPDHHVHGGYVLGKTISTFDTSDELRYDVRGVVDLPDGSNITVRAQSFAMAQWFAQESTCIEIRNAESSRTYYRLAAPDNCAALR